MKITKKSQVICERERRVTIRFSNLPIERFCPQCSAETRFLTVQEAALVKQVKAREIFRLAENGQVHFDETESATLLICLASLLGLENDINLTIRNNK